MVQKWTERYSRVFSAGIIATTASEEFGNSNSATGNLGASLMDQKRLWGSMNTLFITNNSTEVVEVLRDGVDTIGFCFANGGVFSVKAEDGVYFDWIRLTNRSGTNTSADEIKIRVGRSDEV